MAGNINQGVTFAGLRLRSGGGTAALRFWAFTGAVASADGDAADNQYAAPWAGFVRFALVHTTADPGLMTVGMHIDRNLVASITGSATAAGGDVVTTVALVGGAPAAFSAGDELSFSVDPANDPGASYMTVGIVYEGGGAA